MRFELLRRARRRRFGRSSRRFKHSPRHDPMTEFRKHSTAAGCFRNAGHPGAIRGRGQTSSQGTSREGVAARDHSPSRRRCARSSPRLMQARLNGSQCPACPQISEITVRGRNQCRASICPIPALASPDSAGEISWPYGYSSVCQLRSDLSRRYQDSLRETVRSRQVPEKERRCEYSSDAVLSETEFARPCRSQPC